jgi:PAS domain S-box-containing protein
MTLSATRMGMWRWDAVKDEVSWDARMLEIFGVPNEPRTSGAYIELVHPDDRERVAQAIAKALDGGTYPGFEHRVIGMDGAPERHVMTVGAVMRDTAGKSVGFVGGVLDITEQKRMTLQLQRAERVEALGQLTAGIAHNFNNLLAAILPNIEMTLPTVPPERRNGLNVALEASLQARELIKGLLTFASRKNLHTRDGSDARDLVSRIESICRATFPREIELVSAVDSHLGTVAMPATDLEQVLLNLLFNARDAVLDNEERPKRIEVRVDALKQTGQPDRIRFRVMDTGPGMAEDVRARVFEPFFTTKPAHRGSGLGLANALARVSEAQGTLHCQSEVGRGTTFTLVLPTMPQARGSATPGERPTAHAGRGELVLIVDDEPLVRNVTAAMLRDEGYATLEAGSAAEARSILDEQGATVRLIVLDVSMPRESGVQALPTLRARTGAPIVMFTGWATDVPEGADAVLTKPARGDELYAVVRTMLDKTRS